MKYNIQIAGFAFAYWCTSMLHLRIFPKLSMKYLRTEGGAYNDKTVSGQGQSGNTYLHNQDLVSKFRIFDNNPAMADTKQEVTSYLDMYETGPLTKASMLQRMNDGRGVDESFANKF
jgi:hypothetical protein